MKLDFTALPLSPPFPLVRIAARVMPRVEFFVETKENVVALTLDDGPHEVVTSRVLDVLAEHKARATFFLIGSRAEGNRDLVSQIVSDRHEIGNHGWEEERALLMSASELKGSLSSTHELLTRDGATVRLFRPGGGWIKPSGLDVVEKERHRCVLGSVYPFDAHVRSPRWIVADVLRHVRPGAIIILHEGTKERARIVPILEGILPVLRKDYCVTTASDLLALSQ